MALARDNRRKGWGGFGGKRERMFRSRESDVKNPFKCIHRAVWVLMEFDVNSIGKSYLYCELIGWNSGVSLRCETFAVVRSDRSICCHGNLLRKLALQNLRSKVVLR